VVHADLGERAKCMALLIARFDLSEGIFKLLGPGIDRNAAAQ
jgi:hypothetical protein